MNIASIAFAALSLLITYFMLHKQMTATPLKTETKGLQKKMLS